MDPQVEAEAARHKSDCKCIVRLDRVCRECPCSGKNSKKQVPKYLRSVIPYKKFDCGSKWVTYWKAREIMEDEPPEGCDWLVALEPRWCHPDEADAAYYF